MSAEPKIRYYPPCEDGHAAFCGTHAEWARWVEEQAGEVFCDICDEPHAAEHYIAVEDPKPDLVGIECAAAARHLLAAAAPGNANPTTALLRAAVALSEAGAWVTWTETLHDSTQLIRTMRGDLTKATIIARSVECVDGAVRVAFSDEVIDHIYTDKDDLAAALRGLC